MTTSWCWVKLNDNEAAVFDDVSSIDNCRFVCSVLTIMHSQPISSVLRVDCREEKVGEFTPCLQSRSNLNNR